MVHLSTLNFEAEGGGRIWVCLKIACTNQMVDYYVPFERCPNWLNLPCSDTPMMLCWDVLGSLWANTKAVRKGCASHSKFLSTKTRASHVSLYVNSMLDMIYFKDRITLIYYRILYGDYGSDMIWVVRRPASAKSASFDRWSKRWDELDESNEHRSRASSR